MNKYESGIHSIKLTDQPGNLIPLDRSVVPDLSVRGKYRFGGGDSRDPTTTEQVVCALAIAEPTPDGY